MPGHDVEHRCRVAYRARDRSIREEPAPDLAGDGRERHPPPRRFEPDHTATRGGNAHRAAAVAPLGERPEPGRDLRRRAAARAARGVPEAPGIARRRAETAFGRRPAAVFGGRRLAEQDATRLVQPCHDLRVGRRDELGVVARSERRADPLRPREILDREWDPEEGPRTGVGRFEAIGIAERALGGHGHEGVELRIQLRDATQVGFRDFAWTDLSASDEITECAGFDELFARHAVGLQGHHGKKEITVGGHGKAPGGIKEIASRNSEFSRASTAAAMQIQRTHPGETYSAFRPVAAADNYRTDRPRRDRRRLPLRRGPDARG